MYTVIMRIFSFIGAVGRVHHPTSMVAVDAIANQVERSGGQRVVRVCHRSLVVHSRCTHCRRGLSKRFQIIMQPSSLRFLVDTIHLTL